MAQPRLDEDRTSRFGRVDRLDGAGHRWCVMEKSLGPQVSAIEAKLRPRSGRLSVSPTIGAWHHHLASHRSFDQSMRQRVPVLIQTNGLRLSAGVPKARW